MCGDFDETIVYTGPMFLPKEDPETKRFYVKYEVAGNPPNTPIPNAFFKVIVASKAGTLHAAAFVVPNEPVSADSKLVDFETPLDSVESATGLEFLRNMDRKTVKRLCASYSCDLSRFHRARKQYRDVQNDA